ncbi:hypothetical protein SAMD00019534_089140, partial [Acytostelium subglobosum LB1]|uniref:hypothetical protein n=1 Tax=Acytostelium subglobosum LB1 TaxID=1410327 RepID=UPI000644BA5B
SHHNEDTDSGDVGGVVLEQSTGGWTDETTPALEPLVETSAASEQLHAKMFYRPPIFRDNDNKMRYITLGWGILTMLISGTLYGFSVISNNVKTQLHFDQTEINTSISLGDVGIYLGVTVGYLFDLYGPFYTSLIAAVYYIIGYFGFYLMLVDRFPSNPYLLSFFLFMVGQASHASFTAAIISNIHNFSLKHRGKISGGLVGLFATSSGMFGIIYRNTFGVHKDVQGYILFLSILCSIVSFLGAFLLRYIEDLTASTSGTNNTNYNLLTKEDVEESPILKEDTTDDANSPNYLDGKRDISGRNLLKTSEFWLMFTIYFFVAGCGLMFLNNIGSVGKSLNKKENLRTDLVIVFAACNLTGRSTFGLMSDLFSRKISRFWFLFFSATIISITHMFYAFHTDSLYIVATIFTGIGYGGLVSTMVLLTSLRFGVRNFGLNFGLLAIASAAGSLTFGYISGELYDSKADETNDQCFGEQCFFHSFLLSAFCNAFAACIVLYLIFKSRRKSFA